MNIQELEARFREIDARAESEPVAVSVVGEAESDANLSVSVQPTARPRAGEAVDPEAPHAPAPPEVLLDVNLAEVEVPDEYVVGRVHEVLSNQNPVGDLPGVKVRQVGASANYEVVEDYTYDAGAYNITATTGFVYNRSSVPRVFWVIISKDDLSNVAPLFHDLLYHHGGQLPQNQVNPYRTFQRRDADELFLELMRRSGVKGWRAALAYQAVRRFGQSAWQG